MTFSGVTFSYRNDGNCIIYEVFDMVHLNLHYYSAVSISNVGKEDIRRRAKENKYLRAVAVLTPLYSIDR